MLKQTWVVSAEWAAAQDAAEWLTEQERQQEEAFTSAQRRRDWRAGRLAVKKMLRERWDIVPFCCEVASDGVAPIVRGLSLPAINISLSHCAGRGAASWEESDYGTVGIDIQHVRAVHPGLAKRILSSRERAQIEEAESPFLLLFWALKEAAIKAGRRPYRRALREIEVTLLADRAASIILPGTERPLNAEYLWTENAWLARAVLAGG